MSVQLATLYQLSDMVHPVRTVTDRFISDIECVLLWHSLWLVLHVQWLVLGASRFVVLCICMSVGVCLCVCVNICIMFRSASFGSHGIK